MSGPINIDTLLSRNKAYTAGHKPFPTIDETMAAGQAPSVFLVTCADPRCIPESFLSFTPDENVITVRNAGGNLKAALPELLALDTMVNFKEIMVVKHTDCGSLKFVDAKVKDVLRERASGHEDEIQALEFGSVVGKGLEKGLKEQVAAVKESELVRAAIKPHIRGFVYDLNHGGLTEVEV